MRETPTVQLFQLAADSFVPWQGRLPLPTWIIAISHSKTSLFLVNVCVGFVASWLKPWVNVSPPWFSLHSVRSAKNRTCRVCSSLAPWGYCRDRNDGAWASLLLVRLEINGIELAGSVWCNDYPIPLPEHGNCLQGKYQSQALCVKCAVKIMGLRKKNSAQCLLISTPCFLNATTRNSFWLARQTLPSGSLEHISSVPWPGDPDD